MSARRSRDRDEALETQRLAMREQRTGDIAGQDSECNQLTERELTLEHQRGTDPKHHQTGELFEKLTGGARRRAGHDCGSPTESDRHRAAASAIDCGFRHALPLDRLHPSEGFNEMALNASIRFRSLTQLLTDDRMDTKVTPTNNGTTANAQNVSCTE